MPVNQFTEPKEAQKFCPFCGSASVFEVSRIDKRPDIDVFYRYRCNTCGKVGLEFKNDRRKAWATFENKEAVN